jgi:2-polyprenyl-6-methoxyphenol hydroxylase-like FAD-dependent oxidoreductase
MPRSYVAIRNIGFWNFPGKKQKWDKRCGRRNAHPNTLQVHIIEASDHLDQQPRAAHYGPPAIPEFSRAGILAELRSRGLTLNTLEWRSPKDHSRITGFDLRVISDVNGMDLRTSCLVLQDLDQLMLDLFLENGGTISWEHKVVNVVQDKHTAWAEVELPSGEKKKIEADYIVGCDGANSTVRKSLFGNDFPGFTWDAQIIATNVRNPLTNERASIED